MRILIEKSARRLKLLGDHEETLLTCPVALGAQPVGPKEREGDGKTPEGDYFICLKKRGKYGPSLGVSYPSVQDALRLQADDALLRCIRERTAQQKRPPWGTPLGGEIYLHGGGTNGDWTAGCVALSNEDAEALYARVPLGTPVRIIP